MENEKCLIFTSCPDCDTDKLASRIPTDAYVICADGGYLHSVATGRKCDLLVGDRDSLGKIEVSCEELRAKKHKDDTDLMLAIKTAIERGKRQFIIADSLTGRFEHVLSNIQALFYLAKRGFDACIISPESELVFAVGNTEINIKKENYSSFSLLAYGGDATGVCIDGAEYPLSEATLTCDFPLGVSNEFLSDCVTVKVGSGAVLIVKTL